MPPHQSIASPKSSVSATQVIRFSSIFLYGAGFHFLLLKAIVRWAYPQLTHRPSFVDSSLLNIGLPILGGLCTLSAQILLSKFVNGALRKGPAIILRAGLYGVLSTTVTLQAVFLILSARLASNASSAGGGRFVLGFLLAILGIETYGLFVVVFSAPFAFLYGMGLALPFLWLQLGARVAQR